MTDLARLQRTLLALRTLPDVLRRYPALAARLREALEPESKPAGASS